MKSINKISYSERVADLIKSRIRSRKLRPGETISELSLAEECGISRSPVREALHMLESEGFLMSNPKRGKCVTVLTPQKIRDSYELSALLEAGAAANAANNLPESVRNKLKSIMAAMKDSGSDSANIDYQASLSSAFHETVLSLSDNEMLHVFASRFSRVISKYLLYQEWRSIYTSAEQYQRHKEIYDALLSGDPETIRTAVCKHYADSAERLAAFCELPSKNKKRNKAHFPTE